MMLGAGNPKLRSRVHHQSGGRPPPRQQATCRGAGPLPRLPATPFRFICRLPSAATTLYHRGMPNYRRAFVPGGCWFFTVNLLDRRRRLLTDHIDALREATRRTQVRHPFTIDAMVVLPDHIHAIWTLPPDDADFSLRWRLIKIEFAKAVPELEFRSDVRIRPRRTCNLATAVLGTPDPR